MDLKEITQLYDFTGKTIVITGATGVLGGEIACALLGCGANIAMMDRNTKLEADLMKRIDSTVGQVIVIYGNVMKRSTLEKCAATIIEEFGRIDCLVNAAGGNHPDATTGPQKPFFDLPEKALQFTSELNLLGTMLPSQVFGKYMAAQKEGIILNIASMNAIRPLTRIPAYSAAKAAVSNFTQWLAVHMAQEYSPDIRVNAVAPGFFLTRQNRFLLTDEKSGDLTARGQSIIDHTPMGRFGQPADLLGTVLWLLSPASKFVTGIVVPVDGGFSAFSGV